MSWETKGLDELGYASSGRSRHRPRDAALLVIHPVLVSGIAQFQLLHTHPFLDGNGRTSRLPSQL